MDINWGTTLQGNNYHVVIEGHGVALCNPKYMIWRDGYNPEDVYKCRKCLKRLAQLNSKEKARWLDRHQIIKCLLGEG